MPKARKDLAQKNYLASLSANKKSTPASPFLDDRSKRFQPRDTRCLKNTADIHVTHGDDTIEDIFLAQKSLYFFFGARIKLLSQMLFNPSNDSKLAWKRLQPRPTQDINANLDTTLKLTTIISPPSSVHNYPPIYHLKSATLYPPNFRPSPTS